MSDAPAGEPGLLDSAVTTVRLILGWACAAIGALNLAMGAAGTAYLLFHVMLLVTALGLLGWGHFRPEPRRVIWSVAATVFGLGVAISTAFPRDDGHGLPFAMVAEGGRLDAVLLGADLVFWACAGFLVLAVLTLLLPAPRPAGAPLNPTHAEPHPADAPVPRDENVGGLP
nr:hypothetical protein [uncultured Actinoplanes sp.]